MILEKLCQGRGLERGSSLMGLYSVISQNGGSEIICSLNSSVLNKMPRDYTAFPPMISRVSTIPRSGGWSMMYSPFCNRRIPYMLRNGNNSAKRKRNPSANASRPAKKSQRKTYASAPVARSLVKTMSEPKFSKTNGGMTISHREYVADVVASSSAGTFAVTSYSINPGLAGLFPWLSNLAPNFESYRFTKLTFDYEPQCPSSSAGRAELAVDYDASDSAPLSKAELMSNVHAVPTAVWQPCKYQVDFKNSATLGQRRYVRSGTIPSGTDLRAYDLGNLLIATTGSTASLACGELYVAYTVELLTPQSDISTQASSVSAKMVGGTGIDKTHAFGTGSATITGSLPILASVNTITFNKVGEYLLDFIIVGTGLSGWAVTGTPTGLVQTAIQGVGNAGDTLYMHSRIVRVTAVGATLVLDVSGVTTLTALTARIAPYAYASA